MPNYTIKNLATGVVISDSAGASLASGSGTGAAAITLSASGDAIITLGDTAGSNFSFVKDSNGTTVFSVDSLGNLIVGGNANLTGTLTAASIKDSSLTSGRIAYAGTSGLFQDSSNLTFDGTSFIANRIKSTSLSAGRIPYIGTGGVFVDSSDLVFAVSPILTSPLHIGSITNGTLTNPSSVFVRGNYAYLTAHTGNDFEIVDISNPATPVHVASLSNGGGSAPYLNFPQTVFISGNYAYIASEVSNALEIIDISNPASPTHVGSLLDGGGSAPYLNGAYDVVVSGSLAYVVGLNSGALEIIDVSNPAAPTHVGSLLDGGGSAPYLSGPIALQIVGNYAYVASFLSGALEIVDVSNPSAPVHVGAILDGQGGAHLRQVTDISVSGNYAYITSEGANGLEIIDISNPLIPVHAGFIGDGGGSAPYLNVAQSVFVVGNYAYVASYTSNAIEVIDVTDPSNPVHYGSILNGSGGALLSHPESIFIHAEYAYVASSGSNALEIIKISSDTVLSLTGDSIVSGSIDVQGYVQNTTASQPVLIRDDDGLTIANTANTESVNMKLVASNTLSVSGSMAISSLTSSRVPYAGTSGLLQDSANLTFDGTNLNTNILHAINSTNGIKIEGALAGNLPQINVGFNDGNIRCYLNDGGGVTHFVVGDDSGNDKIFLRSDGSLSAGAIGADSITDVGLTSGRITYAGTSGLLQDSANLTFNGTVLTTQSISVTGTTGLFGHSNQLQISANNVGFSGPQSLLFYTDGSVYLNLNDHSGGSGFFIRADDGSSHSVFDSVGNLTVGNNVTAAAFVGSSSGPALFPSALKSDTIRPYTNNGNLIISGGTGASKIQYYLDDNIYLDLGDNIGNDKFWIRGGGGNTTLFTVDSAGHATVNSLTSGRITYAGSGGLLQDSGNLTFDGTSFGLSGSLNVKSKTGTHGLRVSVVYVNTTDATPTVLTFDGTAASALNIPLVSASSTHSYHIAVTARDTTNDVTAAFIDLHTVLDSDNTHTITVLESFTGNEYKSNAGLSVTVLADNINGGLNIQVVGLASTNITWVATIQEIAI